MATSYTSLLGFALPVTGELDGTWGDVVNNSITQLVEDSVAGAATQSVASGDWTLTTTGSGASNQARCAILIPTGSPGVSRNIIAPSSSKAYVVINQSNAAVVLKASATTGTTIASGTEAICAWNGSDFVTVATADIGNLSGTLGVAKGGTGNTTIPARSVFVANTLDTLTTVTPAAGQSIRVNAGNTAWEAYTPVTSAGDVSGPASSTDNAVARFDLTTGKLIQNSVVTIADTTGDIAGAGSITSTSASGILTRAAATQDGVELTGRAGGTNSYKVTFTPTTLSASRTLTLPDASGTILQSGTAVTVAQGGTGSTTLTANNVILGNGTSAVQFVAPGTNGNVLTSNGTTWTSAAGSSLATPLAVVGNNTAGSEIRLPEDTDNGSNYVALKAANSLASNVTFTLPDADGTSGQVIQTNGSGTLSFVSPGGAWVYISTTTASSSATISIEDNFSTYDLYAIQIVNLVAESNVSNFQVELKIDGSYQTASQYGTSQATVANTWASATGNLPILFSNLSGNNLINAWMTLYIPKVNTSTPKKTITAIGGYIYATDSARNIHGSLNYNGGPTSNAISGFRFKFDTGNISTGTFRLYGIKNS